MNWALQQRDEEIENFTLTVSTVVPFLGCFFAYFKKANELLKGTKHLAVEVMYFTGLGERILLGQYPCGCHCLRVNLFYTDRCLNIELLIIKCTDDRG